MLPDTTCLYITDKTGKKFFKTLCSTTYKEYEHRNLRRHLDSARKQPMHYRFLDIDSAEIVEEFKA